jgi:uncharacterized membrane protein
MRDIQRVIEVEVPVTIVYDQWTHFEEFPQFMAGIRHVERDGDQLLHWEADVAGHTLEWEAVLGDQEPCRLISWHNAHEQRTTSEVRFEPLGPERTRVLLLARYEQERLASLEDETVASVGQQLESDLSRFKRFIEARHAGAQS